MPQMTFPEADQLLQISVTFIFIYKDHKYAIVFNVILVICKT